MRNAYIYSLSTFSNIPEVISDVARGGGGNSSKQNLICLMCLQTEKDSSEEETDEDEERSRTRLRCYQGDRESPDDEPSELVSVIVCVCFLKLFH